MKTYMTRQGDMWDSIAYEQMGTENGAGALMAANPEHLETYIFPAGVSLTIPDVTEDETAALPMPPWKGAEG